MTRRHTGRRRIVPDTGTVVGSQRASIDDEDLIDPAVFDTLAKLATSS